MEQSQDGDDLAGAHGARSLTNAPACRKKVPLEFRIKGPAKIVDLAKNLFDGSNRGALPRFVCRKTNLLPPSSLVNPIT